MKKILLISLFFLANALSVFGQSIIYVDADAGGANDGTSWTDAFDNLQDALDGADGSDEIWIAQGTYYPDEGSDRSASFTVTGAQDGLNIYGGFENGDADLEDRNPGDHPVILSGDIGTTSDDSDNSYHVLVIDGTSGGTITNDTVLDGVTVTAGNGNGSSSNNHNRAGGLYCIGNGAGNECSPTIINVVFADNFGAAGGAIYNFGDAGISSPNIINSVFTGNNATVLSGTAVANNGNNGGESSPNFINTTFTGNSGGIYNSASGGGTSEPQITNTILWGNGTEIGNSGGVPDVTYSLVEGDHSGTGNISSDPLFTDASDPAGADNIFATADDGLTLLPQSPAINAGDNDVLDFPSTDITGADRIQIETVDIGAFESDTMETLPFELTKIQPLNNTPGNSITIHGFGLDSTPSENIVTFLPVGGGSGTTATVTVASEKKLTVTVPTVAGGNYLIRVENTDGAVKTSPEMFSVTTGGSLFSEAIVSKDVDNPDDIYSGDINGDENLDLLVVSRGEDRILWLESDGAAEPSFTEHLVSDSISTPIDVYAADIDGDGDLDIISVSTNPKIVWFENDGSSEPSFTAHEISVAGDPLNLLVGDVDGDGHLDLIVSFYNSYPDKIAWYKNNGEPSPEFTQKDISISFSYPRNIFAADIDGDGDLDLLASSTLDDNLAWYENDGSPNPEFTEHEISSSVVDPYAVYVSDINGDGHLDLLTAAHQGAKIAWYENNGAGTPSFTEHSVPSSIERPYNLVTGDMDGDGNLDIVSSSFGSVTMYKNDGAATPSFTEHLLSDYNGPTHGLNLGDIDGNGYLDIFTASNFNNIYLFKNLTLVEPETNISGRSIAFNGGRVNIPDNDTFNNLPALTIELWFKINSSKLHGLVEKWHPSTGFWLRINEDNKIEFNVQPTSSSGSKIASSAEGIVELDTWYHLAARYDGTDSKLYLNGVDVTDNVSSSHSGTIRNNHRSIAIGDLYWVVYNGLSGTLDGSVDEVRFWNTTRTEEEIHQNMYQKSQGDESGLIAYYPFDELNGSIALDKSSNENFASINNDILRNSETHPYGTFITGTEGWRMMSAPAEGATYGETLDPLWTQGFPGSDSPDHGTSNVLMWDESAQSFTSISDAEDVPAAGAGFITFVYEDDNYDGNPDDFPKEIRSDSSQVSGAVNAAVSFTDSGTLADDGWNLLGNPYGATIDWDASGWTNQNLDASFYLWNAEAGEYQSWNGETGTLASEGLIAPWQGFWVKANAADPELTFTDEIRSAGGFLRKEQATPELRFTISDGQLASDAIVMFSEESAAGKDRLDAYKLASLNEEYLSLFTELEDGAALDINALPAELEESVSLPLDIDGSDLNGEFELSWNLKALPEDWRFTLQDNESGEEFDLREQSAISFQLSASSQQKKEGGDLNPSHMVMKPKVMKAKSTEQARFTLNIISAQAVNNEQMADLPQQVELQQNYPNPFNPTTTIQYGVPEAGEVSLEVFDMLGRKVATLINGENKSAGRHTVQFDAARFSSGMYIYRLKAANTVITKKLTLIK
ncbi:MAG: FG-GAP-like repeat-containing protein [Gracilimonas sp.]